MPSALKPGGAARGLLLLACGMAGPLAAGPATAPAATSGAASRAVLVELFTSQGCSSCPAADSLVGELPRLGFPPERVVPVTFHVSYWDDLGWKDRFAQDAFNQRQLTYATAVPAAAGAAGGEPTIRGPYTPQMVVDGQVHFPGGLRDTALAEIRRAAGRPLLVDLTARATRREGEGGRASVVVDVTARALPGAAFDTDAAKIGIFAALTETRVETPVKAGENAGRKLVEYAVARALGGPRLFRSGRPVNRHRLELAVPGDAGASGIGVVVWVQELATLKVLAARAIGVEGEPAR